MKIFLLALASVTSAQTPSGVGVGILLGHHDAEPVKWDGSVTVSGAGSQLGMTRVPVVANGLIARLSSVMPHTVSDRFPSPSS